MSVMQEFKQFIMRGNVLDLAVGVVIGAAFSKIVSSLVSDLLMPPLGLLIGKVDFSNLFIDLNGQHYATLAAAKAAGAPTLNIGLFFNNVLDFVIIAFSIFLVVKGVNALARRQPAEKPVPPPLTTSEKLLGDIRDLLATQSRDLAANSPAAYQQDGRVGAVTNDTPALS